MVAQLRQRLDQLFQLGALDDGQLNEVIDFGLGVDHGNYFLRFGLLSSMMLWSPVTLCFVS